MLACGLVRIGRRGIRRRREERKLDLVALVLMNQGHDGASLFQRRDRLSLGNPALAELVDLEREHLGILGRTQHLHRHLRGGSGGELGADRVGQIDAMASRGVQENLEVEVAVHEHEPAVVRRMIPVRLPRGPQ